MGSCMPSTRSWGHLPKYCTVRLSMTGSCANSRATSASIWRRISLSVFKAGGGDASRGRHLPEGPRNSSAPHASLRRTSFSRSASSCNSQRSFNRVSSLCSAFTPLVTRILISCTRLRASLVIRWVQWYSQFDSHVQPNIIRYHGRGSGITIVSSVIDKGR